MSFMKGAMLLLLLAAVSTNAAADDCGGLNKTMPGADLNKVTGDWVLVWAVSDDPNFYADFSTSHVQMNLVPDKNIMSFAASRTLSNGSCFIYNAGIKIVPELHKLDMVDFFEVIDGVVVSISAIAKVEFFETCPDCAVTVYRGKYEQLLSFYRREGHHQNLEKNAEAHGDFQKVAECLGLPLEGGFIYQGGEDLCPKKPPA